MTENPLVIEGQGIGVEQESSLKYAQSLLYNKGLLTLEKTFLDLYPICSNSIPPNIVPESILSPLRWGKKQSKPVMTSNK